MSKTFEIECPCCNAKIVVDANSARSCRTKDAVEPRPYGNGFRRSSTAPERSSGPP